MVHVCRTKIHVLLALPRGNSIPDPRLREGGGGGLGVVFLQTNISSKSCSSRRIEGVGRTGLVATGGEISVTRALTIHTSRKD